MTGSIRPYPRVFRGHERGHREVLATAARWLVPGFNRESEPVVFHMIFAVCLAHGFPGILDEQPLRLGQRTERPLHHPRT
jgi:hypothetical protein